MLFESTPVWSMPGKPKSQSERYPVPGPGTYMASQDCNKPKPPGYLFGSSIRPQAKSPLPLGNFNSSNLNFSKQESAQENTTHYLKSSLAKAVQMSQANVPT